MKLIDYPIRVDDLSRPIRILNFGDTHEGNANVDYLRLLRDIETVRKDPWCYASFGGDGIEAITNKDKRFDYQSLHAKYVSKDKLSHLVYSQQEELAKLFDPIRDRFIWGVSGNHPYRHLKEHGLDGDYMFCRSVGLVSEDPAKNRYDPNVCITRLSFTDGRHKRTILIYAQHYCGGGTGLVTSNLAWMQRVLGRGWGNVDVFITNHVHKKGILPEDPISLSTAGKLKTVQDRKLYVVSGSYLRVYVDGQINYAEGRVLPTALGGLTLEIVPETQEVRAW